MSADFRDREIQVKERELDKEWVQLALTVLSDEGYSGHSEMRGWSIDTINYFLPDDGVKIDGELKKALLSGAESLPSRIRTPDEVRYLFTNGCEVPLRLLFAYRINDEDWVKKDWVEVKAGRFTFFIAGNRRTAYYYAEGLDEGEQNPVLSGRGFFIEHHGKEYGLREIQALGEAKENVLGSSVVADHILLDCG